MKEAAQNARDCAKSFVGAIDEELGELVYLNQGVISISASDESEASNSWYEQVKSVEKKLRLVVRAGFKKKQRIVGTQGLHWQ